jgi:hypothetical protein
LRQLPKASRVRHRREVPLSCSTLVVTCFPITSHPWNVGRNNLICTPRSVGSSTYLPLLVSLGTKFVNTCPVQLIRL